MVHQVAVDTYVTVALNDFSILTVSDIKSYSVAFPQIHSIHRTTFLKVQVEESPCPLMIWVNI